MIMFAKSMLRAGAVVVAKRGLCTAQVCTIVPMPAVCIGVAIASKPLPCTPDIYADVERKGDTHAIAPSAADSSAAESEEDTTGVIEETEVIGTAQGDKTSHPSFVIIVAVVIYCFAEEAAETTCLER